MRFKPVYLGFADRTVRKLHSGEALHFPPTRRCRICGPDNVGCAPPARCDALNMSHLAKDLKCNRQPSPLAVTDLCRACSALAFSEFKRGRWLFGHCTPAGSDPPPNGPLHGLVGRLSIEWRCVEVDSLKRLQLPQPRILRHEADV
jgi:hypothetical protein